MDTNEELAVKIVRDCLTAARESLPSCFPELWVREMPELEFQCLTATESVIRHALIAALRVAAMRSTWLGTANDYTTDVRITRVRGSRRRVTVYGETNTGYACKVVCTPLRDTTGLNPLSPCLMTKVDTYAWGDAGWITVMSDYVNLV